jgi:hypothetical protein
MKLRSHTVILKSSECSIFEKSISKYKFRLILVDTQCNMWNSPYTQYIDYKFPELALQLLTKATEVASLRKASSCTSPEESQLVNLDRHEESATQ